MPLRMTDATKAVLRALASANGETTGYAIAQATGYGSGTIHPILSRLAKNDFATMRKETPDEMHATGASRPLRAYYTITKAGRELLTEREPARAAPQESDYEIKPHMTGRINVATGDLHVTLSLPQSLPHPKIGRVTVRTERPDGTSSETIARTTTEDAPGEN